ncbi:hypothetical protein [Acidovorax sp. ACV01]|uniref:hypothetical protein n=1 Tax=Acidovorax sp. ACV01 TaxID=2769311 RepID=UPI0017844BA3|nr:hypothetical protein [Acidovorax sp. ACV01]MBD9390909.1 hypothetical protein [Acidovorax sp. ACV01]
MRAVFGLVGLVVALAVVGVVVKKQMSAMRKPVPTLQTTTPASAPVGASSDTVRDQSQQIQQQVKQQVEGLMQQARPMPDEEK